MSEDDWTKLTIENSKAIARLIPMVEATSRGVDKLVRHEAKIDKLIVQNDSLANSINLLRDELRSDKKKLKPVYTVMENKRAYFVIFVGAWALTFYEVRNAVLHQMQPMIDLFKIVWGIL